MSDLSPLRGMALKELNHYHATRVAGLSPLIGMPLELLNLGRTTVTDLSPLEDKTDMHTLILESTPVADLSRLRWLPLRTLHIQHTRVSDLAPLRGMPLRQLWLDPLPGQGEEELRSLKGLEQINGKPAAEFWKVHQK